MPRNVVAVLNREWLSLESSAVSTWSVHPELAGCGTPGDVLLRVAEDPDAALGRLIALFQEGDLRAGRVVLQAMLGKIVLMAAADPRCDQQDYLAEFWLTLAAYPLRRRPRRIAANLALDTRKAVWARGRVRAELPWEEEPPASSRELTGRRVIAAAGELGLIDAVSQETLRAVYCDGLPSRVAAEDLGTTSEMIRWRNSRSIRRLAGQARRLLAAA